MKTSVGLLWVLTLLAACGREPGAAQVANFEAAPTSTGQVQEIATIAATPTFAIGATFVVENRGAVCFQSSDVTVRPGSGADGVCFSSSCTEVIERGGTVRVDPATSTIYVTSRFVVQNVPGVEEEMISCTEDCSGAGELLLEGEPLAQGLYTVWHGDTLLGELDIRSETSGNETCLELAYPTQTPEPYYGPTMTPEPTFVPPPTITPGASPTKLPPGMPYPGPAPVATAEPAPYPTP